MPAEEKPAAIGLPGRIGRWSPEQRAAAMQRQKVMRFLQESCLLSWLDIQTEWQRRTGVLTNPHNDARAAGWGGRTWLNHAGKFEGVGYRQPYAAEAEIRKAYGPADVMPDPPFWPKDRVAFWLYANSTMPASECAAAVGLHQSVFSRRGVKLTPRDRSDEVDALAASKPMPPGRRGCPVDPNSEHQRYLRERRGEVESRTQNPRVRCECGAWVVVMGRKYRLHRKPDGSECPNSRQRPKHEAATAASSFGAL